LAASSGIVGASAPTGAGFALAASRLRPGTISVAFFGEGAANQGMLLETMNLASAWRLPLLMVCKDNAWSITTRTSSVTGGDLVARAKAFGLETGTVDGLDPIAVSDRAKDLISRIRLGRGPAFLHARCTRLDGHFLGDGMVAIAAGASVEGVRAMARITRAAFTPGGASLKGRASAVRDLLKLLGGVRADTRAGKGDPLVLVANRLRREGVDTVRIDDEVATEMASIVATALQEGS